MQTWQIWEDDEWLGEIEAQSVEDARQMLSCDGEPFKGELNKLQPLESALPYSEEFGGYEW